MAFNLSNLAHSSPASRSTASTLSLLSSLTIQLSGRVSLKLGRAEMRDGTVEVFIEALRTILAIILALDNLESVIVGRADWNALTNYSNAFRHVQFPNRSVQRHAAVVNRVV